MPLDTRIKEAIKRISVFATGKIKDPVISLYRALKGKVKELSAVGDCVAPRRALDAVHEGYNTARLL